MGQGLHSGPGLLSLLGLKSNLELGPLGSSHAFTSVPD